MSPKMANPEDSIIFGQEYRRLQQGEKVANSLVGDPSPLAKDYLALLDAYKKLYNQFAKVVNINDRDQAELREAQSGLQKELARRREMEIKLRESQVRLTHAKEVAEKALDDKARFFASMSHELRTPLNGVIGSANLLKNGYLNESQQDYIETIISSGKILMVVINDILDFSKIESGRLELEIQPIELDSLIEGVFDLVAVPAAEKNLELVYRTQKAPQSFMADPTRLAQVLVNLVNNAIKFTEKGQVEVEVTCQGTGEEEALLFCVKDSGIGIEPSQLSKLFTAFTQADRNTSRLYGGTGLGLSICQKLVELFGGKIEVQSVPREGSTFLFTLPLQAPDQPTPAPPSFAALRGKRLLLVEDNQSQLAKLTDLAESHQMQVTACQSPLVAMEAVQAGPPFDLAVIDRMMPLVEGTELLKRIRVLQASTPLPCLMMTHVGQKLTLRVHPSMPEVQMAKPVHNRQWLEAISRLSSGQTSLPEMTEQQAKYPNLAKIYPFKILVAEDNKINLKIALANLELFGYTAAHVVNGVELMVALEKEDFDLILMDVQMPEMDGLETTRIIKESWPTDHRPLIVAMTANANTEDRAQCLEAGMDDFLPKPVEIEHLGKMIEKWGRYWKGIPGQPFMGAGEAPKTAAPIDPHILPILDQNYIQGLKANYAHTLLTELGGFFCQEFVEARQAMETHLKTGRFDLISQTAHKLKGSCVNIGVKRAGHWAIHIETQARTQDPGLHLSLAALKDCEDATLKAVRQYLVLGQD